MAERWTMSARGYHVLHVDGGLVADVSDSVRSPHQGFRGWWVYTPGMDPGRPTPSAVYASGPEEGTDGQRAVEAVVRSAAFRALLQP